MTPDQVRGRVSALRLAGYAALFGTPDAARDTILPGAFAATLANRTERLPLYWQHRPQQRIGWIETVGDADLATGANRLLVGDEIVQFRSASYLGGTRWRLSGLLRGRGATEAQAALGHDAGTRAVLLDQRLLVLEDALFDPATERLAAIGLDDPVPVFAAVRLAGRSRQPPPPVHTRALPDDAGGLRLEWTRRARGGWVWLDGVEALLVEEIERYEVGAGPEAAPLRTWSADISSRQLSEEDLAGLPTGTALWVRQVGRHSRSDASLIRSLP